MSPQQSFERALALHFWHGVALVVLFFISQRYVDAMQGILISLELELTDFSLEEYERPTYRFSIFALFFCLITIYVGYKTKVEKPLRGKLLFGLGGIFFLLAAVMLLSPRYNSIWLYYWLWRGYCATGIILSFLSLLEFEKKEKQTPIDNDQILDDLL